MSRWIWIGIAGALGAIALLGGSAALVVRATRDDRASAAPQTARAQGPGPERVLSVASGDTFTTDGDPSPTRIVGIAAPAAGQCGFAASRRYLRSLIANRRLRLVVDGVQPDRDGARRRLRHVVLRASSGAFDVGFGVVALGWARVSLTHDFAGVAEYLQAQAQAQRERRGMWACR
jgi:endonuclease YncB( thermonuclease family)